jgi:hypothetical protein
MKKVYIAGPIRGYQDGNRATFEFAGRLLLRHGFDPVNPHDIPVLPDPHECVGAPAGQDTAHSYGCYMVPDLHALLDCWGYTLLPGWQKSTGAKVEELVARVCGKALIPLESLASNALLWI